MLALAKIAPVTGGIDFVEREPRQPGPDEALIEIRAAGLCGSDIQIWKWPPHLAKRVPVPCVLGHEGAGRVAAIGERVTNVRVGDNVSLESHLFCGKCYQCLTDRAHICVEKASPGVDFDGVFASYVTVPASILWVNDPDFPAELGAIMEPFGIGVHAALEGTGVCGLTVAINGCGPIGMMNVAVARALGALKVIAIEPNPLRRDTALRMGADLAIDPLEDDAPRRVIDATRGRGADVVIEYSGQLAGLHNCIEMLTIGGDLRLCATPTRAVEYDFTVWKKKRPTIHNINGRRIWSTWVCASDLLREERVDLKPILSHVMPLSEGLKAFDYVFAGEALKPILIP